MGRKVKTEELFGSTPTPESGRKVATSELFNSPQEKSFGQRVWDDLAVPEQASRAGLQQITDAITPSMGDIESGKVGKAGIAARAGMEALTEVAPSFVSRGSILTAGALNNANLAGKAVAPTAKWVGKQAEKLSGLHYDTPGVLTDAFNNPGLMFSKGYEKVREMYEASKSAGGGIRPELEMTAKKMDFIEKAVELAKAGKIQPEEALAARQELDAARGKLSAAFYRVARNAFDFVAKQKFAGSDEAYQQALKADNLLNLLPLNKTGTPSLAKLGVGALGAKFGATPLQQAAGLVMSPFAQGVAASTLGAGAKALSPGIENPGLGAVAASAAEQAKKRYEDLKKNRKK